MKKESEKENDGAAVPADDQKTEENKDNQAENAKSELNDEKLDFNEVLSSNVGYS